jgi:hypothetical protein
MVLGRFLGTLRRMESMSGRDLSVVRRFFVATGFMLACSFPMVFCRRFVMFRCRLMVFSAFVSRHFLFSSVPDFRSRTCYSQSHTHSDHTATG